MSRKIKLGQKYRDNITGFEGTAVSRIEHLHGCVHIVLEAEVKDPGAKPEDLVIDEQRVESLRGAKPKATAMSGGPAPRSFRPTRRTR